MRGIEVDTAAQHPDEPELLLGAQLGPDQTSDPQTDWAARVTRTLDLDAGRRKLLQACRRVRYRRESEPAFDVLYDGPDLPLLQHVIHNACGQVMTTPVHEMHRTVDAICFATEAHIRRSL